MGSEMRQFESGATRNTDEGKNDYEGYLSPLVLEGYGDYMTRHREQADGTLRASDNWQKGIPIEAYRKSLLRHVFTAWMLWRCHKVKPEQVGTKLVTPTLLDSLYSILFNTMGMIHELRKAEEAPTSVTNALNEVAKDALNEVAKDAQPTEAGSLEQFAYWKGLMEEAAEERRAEKKKPLLPPYRPDYWPITPPWVANASYSGGFVTADDAHRLMVNNRNL